MFGLVSKRKVLSRMEEIKSGNRKENLYAKYPAKDRKQEDLNLYSQGYEDGTDNFYNGLKGILE